MRMVLHQFFRPQRSDFVRLWKEALICFDASALLNLYGYSEETRGNLINVIKHYAERTWLPYQFAREYARDRATTIIKQVKNYQVTEKEFEQIASKRLQPKREHPFLSEDALKAFESIREELASKRKALERLVNSDEYADVLLESFEKKVGEPPHNLALQKLHTDADARYATKMPPGYMDKDKGVPEAYGDYIGWRQLMDIAKEEKKDFILVIDDFKEDWWQKDGDRPIGPRPELLEEFRNETGQSVWLYTSESFLIAAKEFDESRIEDEAIREVGALLNAQKAEQTTTKSSVKASAITADDEGDEIPAEEPTPDQLKRAVSDLKSSRPDDVKLESPDEEGGDE